MKLHWKKELPLLAIITIPFLYIFYIWDSLPAKVPMHWNISGEVDRYGAKTEIWFIPIMLPVLLYVIMSVVPYVDPKKKIQQMGRKYHTLKFYVVLSMTILCMLIVYTIQQETTFRSNWLVAGVGLLFLVLGNFFKTIQPNYFVGIRTPWTLEHPTVWKKTHILGGKLWFVGGLVLVVLAFVLSRKIAFMGLTSITIVLVMVPVVYSYMVFQKIRKQKKIES